jgi:SAM-dependent methyltransferase
VTAIDVAPPMLEARRRAGRSRSHSISATSVPAYEDACFDVVLSNFGLIFAPDHANVASELARVSCAGARLGFTAWKPNPKLGELYRRFSEDPIEGREAYEWGREDHVEDMLGDNFDLDFEDGTLWLEADSGEEIWELFSQSAPPVIHLINQLDESKREEFHRALQLLHDMIAAGTPVSQSKEY